MTDDTPAELVPLYAEMERVLAELRKPMTQAEIAAADAEFFNTEQPQ
jgi:hypothetical protein